MAGAEEGAATRMHLQQSQGGGSLGYEMYSADVNVVPDSFRNSCDGEP